jgi:hypothetical protein
VEAEGDDGTQVAGEVEERAGHGLQGDPGTSGIVLNDSTFYGKPVLIGVPVKYPEGASDT